MEVSRLDGLPPPPGIINSIRAGFDTIATHLSAMFLPLLLNAFLWLGPRLRVNAMVEAFLEIAVPLWRDSGIAAQDVERLTELYRTIAKNVNLFALLRTLPIGIPNLFPFEPESSTPLGEAITVQATVWNIPFWLMFLTLLGWAGGALYFYHVSRTVALPVERRVTLLRALIQTTLASIFFNLIVAALGFLFFFTLGLLARVNAILANIFVLLAFLASMWVIVPLFFLPHGMFMKNQNVFASFLSGVQLMRFTMPSSSIFVLVVFLLAAGLNFLWRIPPGDSWMRLVGILGHSFVTTALLAASFIYYRDLSDWLNKALEKLRPNTNL